MGTDIKVKATPAGAGWTCNVRIEQDGLTVTHHTVEVSTSELKRLAPESSVDDLVRRSFEFLLDREPPQSILKEFELSDIERYFPEYPQVIRG
ncbi:MAG: hypothetical protein QOI23_2630 [Chloroflexota bacterium]|jgi:hypothetical protein|nr:hypothetical protein [Chloroflexota bacterium]